MAIEFVCPSCQGLLRVDDHAVNSVVRCGICQTMLRVPASSPDPDDERKESNTSERGSSRRPARPVRAPSQRDRSRRESDDYGEPVRPRRRPQSSSGRGILFWILIIFTLLGVLTVAACGGLFLLLKEKWRPHQSDAGGFKVELPAEPRPDMGSLTKAKHKQGEHVEGTLLVGKLEIYSIMYQDIGAEVRKAFPDDDQILDETLKAMKNETPGVQILREKPITVSGFPAREVEFIHPDGGSYLCRIVVADTRLYIVAAGGPWVMGEGSGRVKRFFDSFEITDPKLIARRKNKEDRQPIEAGVRRTKERKKRDD